MSKLVIIKDIVMKSIKYIDNCWICFEYFGIILLLFLVG